MNQKEIEAAVVCMRIFLAGLALNFDADFHELEEIAKRALFVGVGCTRSIVFLGVKGCVNAVFGCVLGHGKSPCFSGSRFLTVPRVDGAVLIFNVC
jgi:hypothetical protein